MTLNELMTLLEQNPELKEKFNKAKVSLSSEQLKDPQTLSKILSDLGYEISESEFCLSQILNKEIDIDELESVGGGWGKTINQYNGEGCSNDYQDTDCWHDDYCDHNINTYKARSICAYDYSDKGCFLYDLCDSSWGSYH